MKKITLQIKKEMENLEKSNTNSPTCWSSLNNDEFAPAYKTTDLIPAGIYEVDWSSPIGSFILKKQPFNTDELYHLPSHEINDIIQDIETFWKSTETYKKYNFVHKRGILMYGEPGCGKSGIIQLITKNVIEKMNGLVINITNEEMLDYFLDFIPTLRKIEPDRPLIVLLEDLDSIAGENRYSTSRLLNILDGVKQISGIVYLATTNYPEKLQERITNRPSRFDRRYKVELPNSDIRKAYILNKLDKTDIKKINIDDWVNKTDGMSLSHLKEVIMSVMVMGKSFEESISILEGLKKSPIIKEKKEIGFTN
jgi:AAA+ superfamily predicted ATPase